MQPKIKFKKNLKKKRINLILLNQQQHLTQLVTPSCGRHFPPLASETPPNLDSSCSFSVSFAGLSSLSPWPQHWGTRELMPNLAPAASFTFSFIFYFSAPLSHSTDPLAVPPTPSMLLPVCLLSAMPRCPSLHSGCWPHHRKQQLQSLSHS